MTEIRFKSKFMKLFDLVIGLHKDQEARFPIAGDDQAPAVTEQIMIFLTSLI